MERGLTKQRVIAELTRSAHGDLKAYLPIATQAATQDPEFTAHLTAWNHKNGQIRDSKVALPVATMVPGFPFEENSLAHLALLDPRNLVRAVSYARDTGGRRVRRIVGVVERYLRTREANHALFNGAVLQHRRSMQRLYALYHIKPGPYAERVLFKGQYPAGSALSAVQRLHTLSGKDAAMEIAKHKIPFLVAVGALGPNAKDTDFIMAMIDSMTATELVTQVKLLEKLGVKDVPALRAAFEAGLQRVGESKQATFKTTRAAQAMTDTKLKDKLVHAQEKQLATLGSIEGNWLILGDKSPSMTRSIEISKMVAGTLAKMVSGEIDLVFFDYSPRPLKVTGKSYEEIVAETKYLKADGHGTSIGCGLQWAMEKGIEIDGIAVVSDGAENSPPMFADTYTRLCKKLDRSPPVYLYWVECSQPNLSNNNPEAFANSMKRAGHDLQVYDLRGQKVDYYSLPNIVSTMRASRYGLLDEIMSTPLRTLDDVFNKETQNVSIS
jgi:hypothetical protein